MAVTRSKRGKPGGSSKKEIPKPRGVKKTPKSASKSAKSAKAPKPANVVKPPPSVERDENGVAYFYFRSEPTTRMVKGSDVKFSIQDLRDEPDSTAMWDGVRNYTARNWMRAMRVGDRGFFYHSNTVPADVGVVGTVRVVKEAYPDHTSLDSSSPYYDPRCEKSQLWDMVDVKLEKIFPTCVTRESLKTGPLSDAYMIRMARTSVGPVSPAHWKAIVAMANGDAEDDNDKADDKEVKVKGEDAKAENKPLKAKDKAEKDEANVADT